MRSYKIVSHAHQNHFHFKLEKNGDSFSANNRNHSHANGAECGGCSEDETNNKIGKNDEGCPCCAAAIDLDEVATALNEISANTSNTNNHNLGELADFSAAAHWGIFLGISGPLALIGLTAAFRNIKGALNNKSKLDSVIKGLEQDIAEYEKQKNSATETEDKNQFLGFIQRLEAFKETLKYSEFDTKFNLIVPGFINGGASSVVLSSLILSSPWALPVIALYAGCQTTRNSYDLWRTWNRILPEEIRQEIELNMKVGVRKINQITDSKRKFYAANSLGFAAFTAGAVITTISALSVVGAPGVLVGIPLLATGAVSTGITNNIWTNKFKPRNGDLGIDRTKLDLENIKQEIGERRELKKLLKNYRDKHLPTKPIKRFGYSLLSSLPFRNEKGAKLLHDVSQLRISESDSSDADKLDLLLRMINAKIILKESGDKTDLDSLLKKISSLAEISTTEENQFSLMKADATKSTYTQIFEACEELKIDEMVLERFIKNSIIKSSDEHDKSINNLEDYKKKLSESRLFKVILNTTTFDLKALEKNEDFKKAFMNALEECLLFDYVEKLKYEQYGLNDFFWALDWQNKKQTLIPLKKTPTINATSSVHVHGSSCSHHNFNVDQFYTPTDVNFCTTISPAKKKKGKNANNNNNKPKTKDITPNVIAPILVNDNNPNSTTNTLQNDSELTPINTKKESEEKPEKDKNLVVNDNNPNSTTNTLQNDSELTPINTKKESEKKPEKDKNLVSQKLLLTDFNSLAAEKISEKPEQRKEQLSKQNQVIDKVLDGSREFILKSQTKDSKNNQTIFIYADPDFPDVDSADGKARQVVYVRDDVSKKINVLYAEKSRALVIERPSPEKNGLICEINNNKFELYGQKSDSIFQSFTQISPSTTINFRKENNSLNAAEKIAAIR